MKLNEGQQIAANKLIAWYNDPNKKQVWTLAGYAGTGKSTLISYVLNELSINEDDYALCTPTGKAATVLINKGSNATTIHRLIYVPYDINETVVDENGNTIIKKDVGFRRRDSIDKKLIIIDEFSMVGEDIFEDLLSYKVPIICCGDNGQLPPVKSKMLEYLLNPDAQLSEIMRQDDDSAILKVATMARTGQYIKPGFYGNDVIVYDRRFLDNKFILNLCVNADQVICGTNKTSKDLNKQMRNYYGRTSVNPVKGDKVICLHNNYKIQLNDKFSLMNGMLGTVEDYDIMTDNCKNKYALISFNPEVTNTTVEDIITDPYTFTDVKSPYEQFNDVYVLPRNRYAIKKILRKRNPGETREAYNTYAKPELENKRNAKDIVKLNNFDYGYAITCHKSQGSEWDTVVVFDESYIFKDLKNKWLYTAITRARKKLIIIR